jgi:RNA polymerase sigma-70 factor (sigma-E family)
MTIAVLRRESRVRAAASPPAASHEGSDWDADEAVRQLYASHWPAMVRLAALLLRETATAEEVVQDAFVALHRRWPSLRDPGSGVGYLRASVVNGCRSVQRHRQVEVRHRFPGAPAPTGPEEKALDAETDAAVLAAVRRLPERQREVLVMRYYADSSESEIAEALGISQGSVKSHAHRGLATLRSALHDEGVGA